jgi:hypothetical protein
LPAPAYIRAELTAKGGGRAPDASGGGTAWATGRPAALKGSRWRSSISPPPRRLTREQLVGLGSLAAFSSSPRSSTPAIFAPPAIAGRDRRRG